VAYLDIASQLALYSDLHIPGTYKCWDRRPGHKAIVCWVWFIWLIVFQFTGQLLSATGRIPASLATWLLLECRVSCYRATFSNSDYYLDNDSKIGKTLFAITLWYFKKITKSAIESDASVRGNEASKQLVSNLSFSR